MYVWVCKEYVTVLQWVCQKQHLLSTINYEQNVLSGVQKFITYHIKLFGG